MSGINECFSIGSIVHLSTCYDNIIQGIYNRKKMISSFFFSKISFFHFSLILGEVLAFDHPTNMLILSKVSCILIWFQKKSEILSSFIKIYRWQIPSFLSKFIKPQNFSNSFSYFLECPSDNTTKLNDVYIVNLSLIRTIDVKKDCT